MSKAWKAIVLVWLIIISIVSILALCRSFCREAAIGIDYSGILVGILSALVTVLIGWQIYSLIDFSKREEKNREIIDAHTSIAKNMMENKDRGNYLLNDNLSDIYKNILTDDRSSCIYEMIHFKVAAIYYAAIIGEYDVCEDGISEIVGYIAKYNPTISEGRRARLVRNACSVPNQNSIKNFADLINAITVIKS